MQLGPAPRSRRGHSQAKSAIMMPAIGILIPTPRAILSDSSNPPPAAEELALVPLDVSNIELVQLCVVAENKAVVVIENEVVVVCSPAGVLVVNDGTSVMTSCPVGGVKIVPPTVDSVALLRTDIVISELGPSC
jgi:hypothetical protein